MQQYEYDRDELLYSGILTNLCDELRENGIPPKASEIKRHIDTTAFIAEIRTALAYERDNTFVRHRHSKKVWATLDAIEDGQWTYSDDEGVVSA
jgi:hypothetical protein